LPDERSQNVSKVMTWNVEDLFTPGHPSGPLGQTVYNAKILGQAAVINAQAVAARDMCQSLPRRQ
jgi:hypothetical protein